MVYKKLRGSTFSPLMYYNPNASLLLLHHVGSTNDSKRGDRNPRWGRANDSTLLLRASRYSSLSAGVGSQVQI